MLLVLFIKLRNNDNNNNELEYNINTDNSDNNNVIEEENKDANLFNKYVIKIEMEAKINEKEEYTSGIGVFM